MEKYLQLENRNKNQMKCRMSLNCQKQTPREENENGCAYCMSVSVNTVRRISSIYKYIRVKRHQMKS